MRASVVEEATELAAELGDCLSLIGGIETTISESNGIPRNQWRDQEEANVSNEEIEKKLVEFRNEEIEKALELTEKAMGEN